MEQLKVEYNQPIYLKICKQKYWEVCLISKTQTRERVGQLTKEDKEHPTKFVEDIRLHNDEEEAKKYIFEGIKLKENKGYLLSKQCDLDQNVFVKKIKKDNNYKKQNLQNFDDQRNSRSKVDLKQELKQKQKQYQCINVIPAQQNDTDVSDDVIQDINDSLSDVSSSSRSTTSKRSYLCDFTSEQIKDRSKSRSQSPMFQKLNSSKLGVPSNGPITVMLAENWNGDELDPKGYYMSEKLDGVRCFWNGKQMYSRNGNKFYCPEFFTKNWPNVQLDGELFMQRNTFQQTVSIVKKQKPEDESWKKLTYLVFDIPGLKAQFNNRFQIMKEELAKIDNEYIKVVENILCQDKEHLNEELKSIEEKGGEGLMLRDPKSYYENRRSKSLLKVKTFHDAEAIVIGFKPAKGSIPGIGSLHVRNDKGIEFHIGSGLDNKLRLNPPKKGTKITYKYQNLTDKGVPRFPIFLRIFQET